MANISTKDLPFKAEVTYNKARGHLILTDVSLQYKAFAPGQTPPLTIPMSSIVKQLVNPASSSKALIKLQVKDQNQTGKEESHTFQFHKDVSDGVGEDVKRDVTAEGERRIRDKFKDGLSMVMALAGSRSGDTNSQAAATVARKQSITLEDLKQRHAALNKFPQLKKLHYALVVDSKFISEEDFWSLPDRQELLQTLSAERSMRKGMNGQFIDDIVRNASTSGSSSSISSQQEMKFVLNKEIIENIFAHHPKIKAVYDEHVSTTKSMDEKEFWTRCLQSVFFSKDKSRKKDAIFDKAFADEEDLLSHRTNAADNSQQKDGAAAVDGGSRKQLQSFLVDVTEQETIEDFGGDSIANFDGRLASVKDDTTTRSLFRRLNHHSEVVLNTLDGDNGNLQQSKAKRQKLNSQVSAGNEQSVLPKHKQLLKDVTQLDDLQLDTQPYYINLDWQDHKDNFTIYNHQFGVDDALVQERIGYYQQVLSQVVNATTAHESLEDFKSFNQFQNYITEAQGFVSPVSLLPADTYQDLLNVNVNATEILRHLWLLISQYQSLQTKQQTSEDGVVASGQKAIRDKISRLLKVLRQITKRIQTLCGNYGMQIDFENYQININGGQLSSSSSILDKLNVYDYQDEDQLVVKTLSALIDSIFKVYRVTSQLTATQ
ncbi:hypothetical protein MP228_002736 [Amoeboaphelidium protococcarum]|nr:hypothetical protein MP228_002736 [Amoeboaphelidium protococcarum]